jgi:thiosulfate/3-mercaptopyruvate sulfurtransferase
LFQERFSSEVRLHAHAFRFARTVVILSLALAFAWELAPVAGGGSKRSLFKESAQDSAPWTSHEAVEPAALAKELRGTARRPYIVCVGFRTLYDGAHIPGAVFHGPADRPEGLAELKKWAKPLPRSADIVVYCGCCPLAHCPNVRPAFEALRDLGFKHIRVLTLQNDFAHDWMARGYPATMQSGHPQ